jgi:hypothetical protein
MELMGLCKNATSIGHEICAAAPVQNTRSTQSQPQNQLRLLLTPALATGVRAYKDPG